MDTPTRNACRPLVAAAVLVIVASGAASSLHAADRFVSPGGTDGSGCTSAVAPCRTLGSALAAAVSGDVIKLSGGSYKENAQLVVSAGTRTLTIQGAWDPTFSFRDSAQQRTSLSGGRTDRALRITTDGAAMLTLSISQITIEKSTATSRDGDNDVSGGGLLAEALVGSTITLSFDQMTVEGNKAPGDGAGLRFYSDGDSSMTATLTDSTVAQNKATHEGAGIEVDALGTSTMTVRLVRTLFTLNKAKDGGGALDAEADDSSTCIIESDTSRFLKNAAGEGGGALRVSGEDFGAAGLEVVNSVFAGNKAKDEGGAVQVRSRDGSSAGYSSVNSTQTANKSKKGPGGTHLLAEPGSFGVSATIVNDILWGNRGNDDLAASGAAAGGGVGFSVVGSMSSGFTTTEILTSDPMLVNGLEGDVHLQPGSPAIDAGTCAGAPATDFEGTARPQMNGCDIGADELAGP